MNIREFSSDLWRKQTPLMLTGFGFIVLFLILAVLSLFDSQQILGINRWIKPMKFAVATVIFLWTVAVFLYFLRGYEKSSRIISWGVIAMMVGEIILIVMQAVRGTTSHFNNKTAFDGAVFSAMGLMILVNTALIIYLTYLYFRADFDLPKAVVWGMRLGLIVFLLASAQGGYMSAQTGHAVGASDGGAGLPFVNWSTEGGDLRVAHFVGMHAFQAIPLLAVMLVWIEKRFTAIRATALTIAFSLIYFGMFSVAFVQALRGKPLLGKQIIVTEKSVNTQENKPYTELREKNEKC
ncbi:MAG TPA: hypothetical protein VK892_23210 [Pyrinomonadaceae bacterium]|nr:hypothetical protein [Pyrinomonadaceae bacterium]